MSSSKNVVQFENTRNKAKSWYFQSATVLDWWVLGISSIIVLIAWLGTYNGLLDWFWSLLATLFLLPLNIHVEYRHMYSEFRDAFANMVIRRVLKGELYSADANDAGLAGFVRGRRYRFKHARRYVIPLRLASVEAELDNETYRYGVLDELDTNEGYMYLYCEGSAYSQCSLEEQQTIHKLLSRSLNGFFAFADASRKAGVTELRAERPFDVSQVRQGFVESGDPFVFHKDGFTGEDGELRRFDMDDGLRRWVEFRSRCHAQIIPVLSSQGATKPWQMFIIKFNWDDVERRVNAGKLSHEELNEQPLIELGRLLVRELEGIELLEAQNPHIMGPIELAMFIRSMLDPRFESISAFYQDVTNGLIPKQESDLVFVTPEMVASEPEKFSKDMIGTLFPELPIWPRKRIFLKKDRVLIDDTWFMPVRIKQTPQYEHVTKAQGIHRMTGRGDWSSFAQVCASTKGNTDTKMLMFREAAIRSFEERKSRNKIVINPNVRRRQRSAQQSLDEISESSVNQRYVPLVVLQAPRGNEKLLDRKFAAYEAKARVDGMAVARFRSEVRTFDATLSGLLGVVRL